MREPKIGEKVLVKSYKNPEKPLKIEKVALGFVWVKIPYKEELLQIPEEDIVFVTQEAFTGEEKKALVYGWVKPGMIKTFQNLAIELAAFNKLFKIYPYIDFWRYFKPDFKVQSMLWWVGGGQDDLRAYFNAYILDNGKSKQDTNLVDKKIGEDVIIVKKPKSLLDL